MASKFQVTIKPLDFYNKYDTQDYILCGISFDIDDSVHHYFQSECNNNCLVEILTAIDDYFKGKYEKNTELHFFVPWIIGNHVAYSFFINVTHRCWTFRFKRNQNNDNFDFVYQMNDSELLSIRNQMADQYNQIDWASLEKTLIYTFDLPNKEFRWCYSAKQFHQELEALCASKEIKAIYVSAVNYADPITVKQNYVNYYHDSRLLIQISDILLDLQICAEGLFKWRFFLGNEFSINGPYLDFIKNGYQEFCEILDVYGLFTLEHKNCSINQILIEKTDCWPWNAKGFDETQLGDSIELPAALHIDLVNGNRLSLCGWDDDFAIIISPQSQ